MDEKRVHAFAELARQYCSWAEQPSSEPPAQEAETALRFLLELYRSALALPQGESVDGEIESSSYEERQAIYRRFASLPVDLYYEVFHPLESPPAEPVGGTLADDLADIHRDLQRGLVFYRRGELPGAAWEWAFHFRAHWGRHVTGALSALHAWWVDHYFAEDGAESETASGGF